MTATPEQEPVPSRIDQSLPLIDRLQDECDSVGSVGDYIYALGISFNALEEHRANMLQLQRAARFVIDPKGHESEDSLSTDAFYWGEILGYTICDRLIGPEWPSISWQLLHKDYKASMDLVGDPYSDDVQDTNDVSTAIIGELEEMETVPPLLDELIATWVEQVTHNPYLQQNIILGFRYIIRNVINTAVNETSMANECQSIFEFNDIQAHRHPEIVQIDDVRQSIMMWFADHFIDLGITSDETDDEYFRHTSLLETNLNLEMKTNPWLKIGDAIRATGNVLIVTIQDEGAEIEQKTRLISQGFSVEGEVGHLYVFQAPTEEMIPKLQARSNNEEPDMSSPTLSQLYSVQMELINPVIIEPSGNAMPFSKDESVYLVLNNNQIRLTRYVV